MAVINERSFLPLAVNPLNWGQKNKILLLYAFLSILKEHDHDSVEKSGLIHLLLKRSSSDNIPRKKKLSITFLLYLFKEMRIYVLSIIYSNSHVQGADFLQAPSCKSVIRHLWSKQTTSWNLILCSGILLHEPYKKYHLRRGNNPENQSLSYYFLYLSRALTPPYWYTHELTCFHRPQTSSSLLLTHPPYHGVLGSSFFCHVNFISWMHSPLWKMLLFHSSFRSYHRSGYLTYHWPLASR